MDDDLDDIKDVYNTVLPEKDIKWWSRYMRSRHFKSEEEARAEIFRKLELFDTETWSHIFGQNGPTKNQLIAQSMPVYQDRYGRWRIGYPLGRWARERRRARAMYTRGKRAEKVAAERDQRNYDQMYNVQEYLSNMTSDFSDGTNGEPSAATASYAGDQGTNVGLPDYKYLEKKQSRHDKLRALMRRRDPNHTSRVAWDIRARAGIHEDDEADDMKEVGVDVYGPQLQKLGDTREEYAVSNPQGKYLGTVFQLEPTGHLLPSLRQLHTEYSWIAQPRGTTTVSRQKTKEAAVRYLWDLARNVPGMTYDQGEGYFDRMTELRRLNNVQEALAADKIVAELIGA